MKITTYDIPLIDGDSRKGIILEIIDENGNRGVGEIAPLPGWSAETYEEALACAREFYKTGIISNYFPPSVLFGIDMALSQIQQPLDKEISFSYRNLLSASDKEATTSEIKLKIGHLTVSKAIVFVKKHLEIGKTISIDMNRRFSLKESIEFCRHFKKTDFLYIEDPVPEFTRLQTFYEETGFPYAVDQFMSRHPLARILSLKGLIHVVIKPTLHGGRAQIASIIQRLPEKISYSLTSSLETTIGIAHIIYLHHLFKTKTPLGIDTLSMHTKSLLVTPLEISKGKLTPLFYNNMELVLC